MSLIVYKKLQKVYHSDNILVFLFETNKNFDLFKLFCCQPNCRLHLTSVWMQFFFFCQTNALTGIVFSLWMYLRLQNCLYFCKNIQKKNNLEDRVRTPETKLMWTDRIQWYQLTPKIINVTLWPALIMSIRLNPSGLIHKTSANKFNPRVKSSERT